MQLKNMKVNKIVKLTAGLSALTAAAVLGTASVNADSYTIQYGDSFYSIATQFGIDAYELAALNNTTIDSLILPGQELTVPDSTNANQTVTTDYAETTSQGDSVENTYPVGQCTWGVKELAPWVSNWWGNAGDWASNASLQGYSVGYTPTVGSVVCWTDGGYGHVAYVTAVAQNGEIQVLEANYGNKQWIDNYRGWFDPTNSKTPGNVTYIYPSV